MYDLLALAGQVYNKPSFFKSEVCYYYITKWNSKQSLTGQNQLKILYGIQSLCAWIITVVQSPMVSTEIDTS